MHTRTSAGPKKFSRPKFAGSAKPRFGGARPPAGGGRPSHSGGKPSFSGGFKGRSGGGNRGGRGRFNSERIDFSRFIKKAEKVEAKPYVSTHKFLDFPFADLLSKNIIRKGYITPTPIQDQSIPVVMEGKDLFGLANTGTGKTAAFLLPLINRVVNKKDEHVIILAPTRELALQIEQEYREFAVGLGIFSVALVGGMPINKQINELKRGVSFVIGTPGRIRDLIERKVLHLSECRTAVLDEADRMLDMGFRDDMVYILGKLAKERQTLFFSATLSPEIKKMTEEFLKNPVMISVVTNETSKNIDQDIIRIKGRDEKIEQLHQVLKKDGSDKVLIFRETKRSVDTLEKELLERGFKVGGIHGDKRNRERIRTLDNFKQDRINILIATDVAARGLDIPDVTHVINYDLPSTYDTYVHRIGRTGRADKKGTALTFVPF